MGEEFSRRELLLQSDIFRDLEPELAEQLASRCAWRTWPAEGLISSSGEYDGEVLFLVQGCVRVLVYCGNGRQMTYRDLHSGSLVAELSAIDGGPRSATVLAIEDSLMASLPADLFLDALSRSPAAALWELRRLVAIVRDLTERQMELATMPLTARLCAFLLREAKQTGENGWVDVDLPTHHEIANRIGGHREGVTKSLNRLRKEGVVRKEPGVFQVDLSGLRKRLEDVE